MPVIAKKVLIQFFYFQQISTKLSITQLCKLCNLLVHTNLSLSLSSSIAIKVCLNKCFCLVILKSFFFNFSSRKYWLVLSSFLLVKLNCLCPLSNLEISQTVLPQRAFFVFFNKLATDLKTKILVNITFLLLVFAALAAKAPGIGPAFLHQKYYLHFKMSGSSSC